MPDHMTHPAVERRPARRRRLAAGMRMVWVGLILLTATGCQLNQPPADYRSLTQALSAGERVSVADLRDAFLRAPDYTERMERLQSLERQALQLIDDEPLKLGSIGNAILEVYYGSLTGHFVMQRFYEHLETTEAARDHVEWANRIREYIEANGDGSRESPYPVISPTEAIAYTRFRDFDPVGAIYQANPDLTFGLLLAAKPKSGPNRNFLFDLSENYELASRTVTDEDHGFTPFSLMGYLAKQRDSAAQAAIGAYLVSQGQLLPAIDWLTAAGTTGNLYANLMLARAHWGLAEQAETEAERAEELESVLDNYLHAIALGSDEAMYTLATLYIAEQFGPDQTESGLALLQQAADLGNTNAALYLAHLNYAGELTSRDLDAAERLYSQAAATNDQRAVLSWIRFLVEQDGNRPFTPEALDLLKAQTKAEDSEAMVMLGNLYAKGVGVNQNFRKATRWYRSAVRASQNSATIVNEVAWTLAVTHEDRLRSASYALDIMSRMMADDESARTNPAYLDTWAATFAANGEFERAIELQQEALNRAHDQERTDVIEELESHLEAFRAGRVVIDPIP